MQKNILVFNCGSSSLKYCLYHFNPPQSLKVIVGGKAHRVGIKSQLASYIEHSDKNHQTTVEPLSSHKAAAAEILKHLQERDYSIDAIGHRFVHGGSYFKQSTMIDPVSLKNLKKCFPLAPIHNPASMRVIQYCLDALGDTPQYVTFDTAFHATLPEKAYQYALPAKLRGNLGLRKYGFHGLSYQYITDQVTQYAKTDPAHLRMIICHLGTGGSSIAAVKGRHSIETSMGFTPLPGLVMSTRCGDLDPSIPLMLVDSGLSSEEITRLLNKESGLLGISEYSSDLRDIIQHYESTGDHKCGLAFEMYTYRLKLYIGAYIAALSGLDVLVFTDDIGMQSWQVREKSCQGLEWCGISLDAKANREAASDSVSILNTSNSRVQVMAFPNDEEEMIAQEGLKLLK